MPTHNDDYALVIGFDKYPQYLDGRRNLKGAVDDAKTFRDWLTDRDTGGGLPDANVRFVTGTDVNRIDVDRRLDEILDASAAGARRIYFYFAGHGQARRDTELALLLPHWSKRWRQAALAGISYRQYLAECTAFAEVVAFFDCCRVWTVDVTGHGSELDCPIARDGAGSNHTYIGYAAEFQRQAFEGAEAGGASDPGLAAEGATVRGYFTRALMEGLTGGAAQAPGGVPGDQLKGYLETHVPRLARQAQLEQKPRIVSDFPTAAPPVFGAALPPAAQPRPAVRAHRHLRASRTYRLRIATGDPLSRVQVFDGDDVLIAEADQAVDLRVRAGLYRLRVERLGGAAEDLVHVTSDTQIGMTGPARATPVPTVDSASSHEYYTEPSVRISRSYTDAPVGSAPATGAIMVFVRARSAAEYRGNDLSAGLALLRPGTDEVRDLTRAGRRGDHGWFGVNFEAAPGAYVLSFAGPARPREMALWVAPGRQTRVFLHAGDEPVFATAAVQMEHKGSPFDPGSERSMLVDGALAGLQSPVRPVAEETLRRLLRAKFEDPMLGLIGAHLLLDGTTPDVDLLDLVHANLTALLGPDAPDVQAVAARIATAFDHPVEVGRLHDVPMLRTGLDGLLDYAASDPQAIAAGSPLTSIAPHRLADAPWTTWEPVFSVPEEQRRLPAWVVSTVEDEVGDSLRAGRGQEIDVPAIAKRYRLPVTSVREAYTRVRQQMPPSTRRTLVMEGLVTRVQRSAAGTDLTREEAVDRFLQGDDGTRIEVLGLMQGAADLRDVRVAVEAIAASHSAFEQYHGLRLALQMADTVDGRQRNRLVEAVRQQRAPGGWIHKAADPERWRLSDQVLERLGGTGTA